MKKYVLVAAAAALAAPAVFAAPQARVNFYGHNTEIDIDGTGSDDGTGFGVNGWMMVNGPFFIHGEYQTVKLDDTDEDLDNMRLGGGMTGEIQKGTMWFGALEYVDFQLDAAAAELDENGFGVHGGLMHDLSPQFSLGGSLGYLDTDNGDGMEYTVGAHFAFNKAWGAKVDYRAWMADFDGTDVDITSLRAGVSYSF